LIIAIDTFLLLSISSTLPDHALVKNHMVLSSSILLIFIGLSDKFLTFISLVMSIQTFESFTISINFSMFVIVFLFHTIYFDFKLQKKVPNKGLGAEWSSRYTIN
jgi:hypothetical protein